MDWIADRQAFAFAYAGQLRKARILSQLAKQQGDRERAGNSPFVRTICVCPTPRAVG